MIYYDGKILVGTTNGFWKNELNGNNWQAAGLNGKTIIL